MLESPVEHQSASGWQRKLALLAIMLFLLVALCVASSELLEAATLNDMLEFVQRSFLKWFDFLNRLCLRGSFLLPQAGTISVSIKKERGAWDGIQEWIECLYRACLRRGRFFLSQAGALFVNMQQQRSTMEQLMSILSVRK